MCCFRLRQTGAIPPRCQRYLTCRRHIKIHREICMPTSLVMAVDGLEHMRLMQRQVFKGWPMSSRFPPCTPPDTFAIISAGPLFTLPVRLRRVRDSRCELRLRKPSQWHAVGAAQGPWLAVASRRDLTQYMFCGGRKVRSPEDGLWSSSRVL